MNLLILTVGTRGDVQPFVALAAGLQAAGHRVTICTCPRYREFVESYDIAFLPLDEGLLEILDTDLGRSVVENLNGIWGVLCAMFRLIRLTLPINHRMVADAWAAVEQTQPDLILYHPKMFGAPFYAAHQNVPAATAMLCPLQVPTGESPLFGPSWGAAWNRMTYQMLLYIRDWSARAFMRRWQRQHDPERRSCGSSSIFTTHDHEIPVLHGYSEAVCPRPHDWPEHATVNGYWFLPERRATEESWEPSPKLVEFLKSGESPVYIGFGSMAGTTAERTTRTVFAAVEQAGVRAILATGWGGLERMEHSSLVYMLDTAPHDWLFPRVTAVVHHGGAGTTAAGLRAGCPTVICPFGVDQPFWGRRIAALGAGVAPIPQKQLTVERLAEALQQVVSDPLMRTRAQEIATAIGQENGVRNAIQRLEAIHQSY